MKLGEAVYKSQQKPTDKADNNKDKQEGKNKENVVDAEVVDSKEDKEKEPKTNIQEKSFSWQKEIIMMS